MSQKAEFVSFVARSITEIPQDVKILFEMFDDADLTEETRLRVAGALLYLLAPGDVVPDTFGVLGHVDDSLVFRMTMAATLREAPDRADAYKERYPEVFDTLEADLQLSHDFLGEIFPWLESRLDRLDKIEFKGKRSPMFLQSVDEGSWLYGEVSEAMLDFDPDEDELNRDLRKIDQIVPVMRQKMEASRR